MNKLQLAVRTILERADKYRWSVQGFGLLRLYMRNDARIHIWDPTLAYPNVSVIHTHSWDLDSEIVVGWLRNQRYINPIDNSKPIERYHKKRLVTGYNTRDVSSIIDVYLAKLPFEPYMPGDTYSQKAHEIHETIAEPYTVTFMQRDEPEEGQADLYWPYGTEWGTAQPREATEQEVKRAALAVLEKHYAE